MPKNNRKERKKAKREASKGRSKPTMASRADRHVLYQRAVQCVEPEIDFVDATFTQLRGRTAKRLREDFCGTANTSCEWVRRRNDNIAYAVDLDPEVLAWGYENNRAKLGKHAKRLTLIEADVTEAEVEPVDVVLAMNFSYWILKGRARTRNYFRRIRDQLVDDGIFFLDCYGGYESFQEMKERTELKGFTYVWDQARYNPITGDMDCKIHFEFPDGSKMKNAFTYQWRLWTLPEIKEMLTEAGFRDVTVYWEEWDEEEEEGTGEFYPAQSGDADPAWVCYIVAAK